METLKAAERQMCESTDHITLNVNPESKIFPKHEGGVISAVVINIKSYMTCTPEA